jgi:hypothetical protein
MICKACGKEFFEDWRRDKGTKRKQPIPTYCSRACANKRVFSKETYEKRSRSCIEAAEKKAAIEGRTLKRYQKKRKREKFIDRKVICAICKKTFEIPKGKHKRATCSPACLSALLSKKSREGQSTRRHSRKDFNYKGVILNSSYEKKVAEELDENRIKWTRPHPLVWEDAEGVTHRYYPDFYLPDFNVFLDPKNDYLINGINSWFGISDKEKIQIVEKRNGVKILILSKENLLWEKIQKVINEAL